MGLSQIFIEQINSHGTERHLKVTAIKNGTALDHIPAESLFMIDILNLQAFQQIPLSNLTAAYGGAPRF